MQQSVIQIAMLVGYVIVFIYQFNAIRNLKQKFVVLEKFQAIFDLNKIEDYVKVIEHKAEAEIETHKRAQLAKHLKDAVEKEARAQGESLLNRYSELTNFCADIFLENHQDAEFLLDILPLNKEYLERVMNEKRKSL